MLWLTLLYSFQFTVIGLLHSTVCPVETSTISKDETKLKFKSKLHLALLFYNHHQLVCSVYLVSVRQKHGQQWGTDQYLTHLGTWSDLCERLYSIILDFYDT